MPREDGGYEIVSGHRRQKASELAGYFEMPCIVRNLTDEEAITQVYQLTEWETHMLLDSFLWIYLRKPSFQILRQVTDKVIKRTTKDLQRH